MEQAEVARPSGAIEEDAHWWFATRTWAIDKWLDRLPSQTALEILDVGCGAGNMIHHLSRRGRVRGIELDVRPVRIAQSRGYDVRQADASRSIPYPDGSFDLVTALDVIEHVDDDGAVLAEARRVLRPGGHLLVTTPAFTWLWSYNDVLNAHKRRYTAGELAGRIKHAGLTPKRISYNFFLVFPLAAGMILARKGLGRKVELSSHHLEDDAYQVEMEPVSPVVNGLLRVVGKIEAQLIDAVNLPVGTSLICLAEKKE